MRQRGFTITELMIVVAIMGTLTVAVAQVLARWSTSIHISSSIREIASELQLARMKAIAQEYEDDGMLSTVQALTFPNLPMAS